MTLRSQLVLVAALSFSTIAFATPPPRNDGNATRALLQQKADDMAAQIRRSASERPDSVAQQYVRTRLSPDLHELTVALDALQRSGALDPRVEVRAMAAAARVVVAAEGAHVSLDSVTKDKVEALLSRSRYADLIRRHDTAVENEVTRTWGVIAALTTADGTIGPVLTKGGRPAPPFVTELAKGRPVAQIPWDELSPQQKLDLLKSQTAGWDFFDDRALPGVIFRRRNPRRGSREARAHDQGRVPRADRDG